MPRKFVVVPATMVGRVMAVLLSLLIATTPVSSVKAAETRSQSASGTSQSGADILDPTIEVKLLGQEDDGEYWHAFGRRLKITDSLLVVFTLSLAAFTLGLWIATIKLVRGSDDTAKRQLRAYVGMTSEPYKFGAAVTDIPHPLKDDVNGWFIYKNFGQTPASKVTSYHTPFVVVDNLQDFKGFADDNVLRAKVDEKISTVVLWPNEDFHFIPLQPFSEFPEGMRDELISGSKGIFFRGVIKYDDIFGSTHYTYFCFLMRGEADLERCSWTTVDEYGNYAVDGSNTGLWPRLKLLG